MSFNKRLLESAPVIISLATGTLYILGLTYYQAYLREFGLLESQFPLTLDKAIFQGFLSAAFIGAIPVTYLFMVAELVLLLAVFAGWAARNMNKIRIGSKFISSLKNSFNNKPEHTAVESFQCFCVNVFKYSTILLISFIIIIFILMACEKAGKEWAVTHKNNITNKHVKVSKIVLKNTNKDIYGYSIGACKEFCVNGFSGFRSSAFFLQT